MLNVLGKRKCLNGFVAVMMFVVVTSGIYFYIPVSSYLHQLQNIFLSHEDIIRPCSFEKRQQYIEEKCNSSATERLDNSKKALYYVLFDHKNKVLGCTVSKAGSTAWIKYMLLTRRSKDNINMRNFRKKQILKNVNLSTQFKVPVHTINTKYANWTKYMLVRHPMQRLVSAYYDAVVHRHVVKATFIQYMKRLAQGKYVDKNEHWRRYITWCYPCDVKYNFVIKTETMNHDQTQLNKLLFNNNYTVDIVHPSPNLQYRAQKENLYKYDKILTNFSLQYPELINQVVDIYKPDMEMFGYEWDPEHNSSCVWRSQKDGEECC